MHPPINAPKIHYCAWVRWEDERGFHEESFDTREARTEWLASNPVDVCRIYEVPNIPK